MKPFSMLAVGLALLLPAVLAAEDKKDDKIAKLLGTWEVIKAEYPAAPIGATLTFTKDGKLVVTVKLDGAIAQFEGTYKVEGDKLMTVLKVPNRIRFVTETIKRLTDNELDTVNGDGEVTTFRKKPAVLAVEAKKDDKIAKLLGTWEVIKSEYPAAPIGATLTFTKDGKLVFADKLNGVLLKFEGTYKVEGDKLMTDVKIFKEIRSDNDTIKKLTDNELETVNRDGEVTTFKKKKEKDK